MAKYNAPQWCIFKINSSRLRKARWDLTLPLSEARRNDEIISLSENMVLRWVDELNGIENAQERVVQIRSQIRRIGKLPHSVANRKEMRRLYAELDSVQFKPDYMHLTIDRDRDYFRACKGFKINGIKYVRLLGTSGGVKNGTIVFVSERLVGVLRARIENGRDRSVLQIPAKLEAYRALTCSGSVPVSMPKGILVVPDCETKFKEDVLFLSDENSGEPEMQLVKDYEITLDESDGYGLMLPSLAQRWSEELGLGYVAGGMNTRFAWEKGVVFCFDFVDFADKIAHNFIVKDAWGNDVDVRNVELVLTTSMLKLWKCYDSLDDYLANCVKNHYTFGITKFSPAALESSRNLNYQFIQSYNLSDELVDELIQPTMDEIRGILTEDYRKAILFMAGTKLRPGRVPVLDNFLTMALMADPRMFNDPHIKRKIFRMTRGRITDAKIGVIAIHGNYSIVCGDPYALCQSIFGLEVTGLLKAGEIYNKYWSDRNADYLACFRAPMTCHNNIRKMRAVCTDDMAYWYQYITTCTLFNAWDSSAAALNGMDKDGDLVMLTDNRILVDNIRCEPTIFCAQRSGTKIDASEDDLVRANIASFGDDIGKTTNWITSMFDVQAQFDADSEEYKTLDYRIKCGQLYQQNAIDKAKGIICKPMPKYWHDRGAISTSGSAEESGENPELNWKIVADKKPYFMRHIYPSLMSQYNTYIKNANTKCLREFRMSLEELMAMDASELTEEQAEFLFYYEHRVPVGVHDCVMNRICRRFEAAFDGFPTLNYTDDSFDPEIIKSGCEYTARQYSAVKQLFDEHNKRLREYARTLRKVRGRDADFADYEETMVRYFKEECHKVCSNDGVLCDIIVDICYKRCGTMQFAWDVVGDTIVENLIRKNGNKISFPVEDENGDICFGGQRFSMTTVEVEQYV